MLAPLAGMSANRLGLASVRKYSINRSESARVMIGPARVHRPTNAKLCPHLLGILDPRTAPMVARCPGVRGRRLALRSCLSLESLAPASVRWLQENKGERRCQCGCGQVIDLQAWHYGRGIPR